MTGRHRVEDKRTYWRCPTGCGVVVLIDVDVLLGDRFDFLGLFGVPSGLAWLPSEVLDAAEQAVEQHELKHLEAA